MAESKQPKPTRGELLERIIAEAFVGWEKSKAQASSMSAHPKPEFLQVALDAARELHGGKS